MLKQENGSTTIQGFLVGVEVEDTSTVTPQQIAERIADSLTFMEGVGRVDVEKLGRIEVEDGE